MPTKKATAKQPPTKATEAPPRAAARGVVGETPAQRKARLLAEERKARR
jgi:hypothetical protein